MISIKNKTVFITGGGSGIGLATALECARRGANVAIFTKTKKLKPKTRLPENVLLLQGDVTKRSQVGTAMKKAVKKFGSLDILINNAGVARREKFLKTTEKDWDFVINVNMKGVFICIQEFIKTRMSAGKNISTNQSNQHKSALIINIASGAGIYGIDEIAVYSSTKAAVINITQGLDEELKNTGIKFVTVCPGSTNTKMFKNLFPEEKPYHTPEQVARVIFKTITGEIKPDERLIVDVFHHVH